MPKDQPKNQGPAFAPFSYHFQASAAALALRLRRPEDFCHTVGSATLMGIGGCASDERNEQVRLHGGILSADSYRTEVTGDYDEREAASKLTDSHDGRASQWHTNQLAVTTTCSVRVDGMEVLNFDDSSRNKAQRARVSWFKASITGQRSRKDTGKSVPEETRFTIAAKFGTVFINGRPLEVPVHQELLKELQTFSAFKSKFESDRNFRDGCRSMVYHPPKEVKGSADKLYDVRGHAKITVVNKIEWADKKPDPNIDGHTLKVPGLGTIYFGEMTISPLRRSLQMVRVELGCPDGGSGGGGGLDQGGHEDP